MDQKMDRKVEPEYAVDLHTHVTDAYDFVLRGLGRDYVDRDSLAKKVLDKCFATSKRTVAGIINFDDNRAEDLCKRIRDDASLSKGGYTVYNPAFLSVYRTVEGLGDLEAHFVCGQEVPTDKGHLLVLAADKPIKHRKLGDALKESRDNGGIILGDHELAEAPFGLDVRISLMEEDIDEFRDYFDGVGIWTGNYGHKLCVEQRKLAMAYKLPGFVSSDSHSVRDMFSSYMKWNGLNFLTIDKFRDWVRARLKEGGSTPSNTHTDVNGRFGPEAEILRHAGKCVFTNVLHKCGLIKRDWE